MDAIGARGGQSKAPDGFTPLGPEEIEALGTPPTPGDPIAVIAVIAVIADGGTSTTTDAGPVNGYGPAPVPTTPVPSASQEATNGFLSLGEFREQLSPAQALTRDKTRQRPINGQSRELRHSHTLSRLTGTMGNTCSAITDTARLRPSGHRPTITLIDP